MNKIYLCTAHEKVKNKTKQQHTSIQVFFSSHVDPSRDPAKYAARPMAWDAGLHLLLPWDYLHKHNCTVINPLCVPHYEIGNLNFLRQAWSLTAPAPLLFFSFIKGPMISPQHLGDKPGDCQLSWKCKINTFPMYVNAIVYWLLTQLGCNWGH